MIVYFRQTEQLGLRQLYFEKWCVCAFFVLLFLFIKISAKMRNFAK